MRKTINVYEKESDLSQVILGIENDPKRAHFNEIVKVLETAGYTINRFDPVHNKEVIDESYVLPTGYIDETCFFAGEYPSVEDIVAVLGVDAALFGEVKRSNILNEANTTRLGSCCGVGQDVYFDPDEDEIWK